MKQWPPIVLSGPMFSGKTTFAELLHVRKGYVVLRARDVLRQVSGSPLKSRVELQRFGAVLERTTEGRWLGEAALSIVVSSMPVVVDAARTERQVAAVKEALPGACHIHLITATAELQRRFSGGSHDLIEGTSFELAMEHPVEQETGRMGLLADLILDSGSNSPEDLLAQVEDFVRTE